MNLTSTQVADRLGISIQRVREYGKQGRFGELVPTGNGKLKKHFLYPKNGIIEYEKSLKENGHVKVFKVKENPVKEKSILETTSGPNNRLERIEKKLDFLIKMWS